MSCRSNDHLALEKGGGCGFLYSHRCTTRCVRWRGISPKVTSFHWPFAIYTDLNLSDLQESEARTIFSINLMDFDVGNNVKSPDKIRRSQRSEVGTKMWGIFSYGPPPGYQLAQVGKASMFRQLGSEGSSPGKSVRIWYTIHTLFRLRQFFPCTLSLTLHNRNTTEHTRRQDKIT